MTNDYNERVRNDVETLLERYYASDVLQAPATILSEGGAHVESAALLAPLASALASAVRKSEA